MGEQGEWPQDDEHLLSRGTVIKSQYEITGYLGGGGYGNVYLANHTLMGREVAIKVLTSTRDRTARERFLREAQSSAMIDHPHTITVHDFGFFGDEQPFIVMERLKGRDLEEELKLKGPIEPQRALRLFLPCLEALQVAHKHQIVHKDLKPSNLFLVHADTERETLKVIDFGIAAIAEPEMPEGDEAAEGQRRDSARLTVVGQSTGTPRYMAPEYLKEQLATPALDVYQMGLILVEMLTGKPVVDEDSYYACVMKHVQGNLEIPEAQRQGTLGEIILKATAFDPKARYEDAEHFRVALGAYVEATWNPVQKIVNRIPTRLDLIGELAIFAVSLFVLVVGLVTAFQGPLGPALVVCPVLTWSMGVMLGAGWSSLRYLRGRISAMPWFWTRPVIASALSVLLFAFVAFMITLATSDDTPGASLEELDTHALEARRDELAAQTEAIRTDAFEACLKAFEKNRDKGAITVRFKGKALKDFGRYQAMGRELKRAERLLVERASDVTHVHMLVFFGVCLGLLLGLLSWFFKRRGIKASEPD